MEKFGKMRRSAQELSQKEAEEILKTATHGVLAVTGEGGYPYAVPMSFVFADGKIYLHSATEGRKIEAIKRSEKVSFCVVAEDRVIPEKYTTAYKSAIVFGRARIVLGDEAERLIRPLGEKYNPKAAGKSLDEEIAGAKGRFAIIEITPEKISGKIGKELLKREESRCRENYI